MEKKIVIIGANSFIGKNLVKEIGEKKCIQLSSTKKNNIINFNLGDDLDPLIKYPDEVEKIILLSWDILSLSSIILVSFIIGQSDFEPIIMLTRINDFFIK